MRSFGQLNCLFFDPHWVPDRVVLLQLLLVYLTVRSDNDGNYFVLELAVGFKHLFFLLVENCHLNFFDEEKILALEML
jgi:hypothetical protein